MNRENQPVASIQINETRQDKISAAVTLSRIDNSFMMLDGRFHSDFDKIGPSILAATSASLRSG
jgi:hypothetical protein